MYPHDAPLPRLLLVPEGVRVDDTLVRLTRSERALLAWLVAHAGEPQSEERLLREVWQVRPGVSSRTVRTTINRLRAKIEPGTSRYRLVRTVPGGYLYEPPSPDQSRAPGLVGREAEAAAIRRWVRSGDPLLIVTGAPGVGKSALVAEALPPPVVRIDLQTATVAGALDALDAAPAGLVWLDDADPVLAALSSGLTAVGRRLVITCRYPVDHPHATRIHLEPLPAESAHELLGTWLSTRFSGAGPSRGERARWVAEAAGNPTQLMRILWSNEGGGEPPGLTRHQTERETMRWGLVGLPDDAIGVLCRMAAAPAPVDEDAASALLGRDDQRPVLTLLRARWLVHHVDGRWSVPAGVQQAVDPDPAGLEPLRQRVLVRAMAVGQFEADGSALAAWHGCAWGLLSWAIGVTADPDDLADLVQGVDHLSTWGGLHFDSRPILRETLARLPESDHRWWILRRLALAEIRFGTAPDDPEVERLFEASITIADALPPPSFLIARTAWGTALARGGQLGRAIALARETCALAREHHKPHNEAVARLLEATAQLRAGDLDAALWCARAALAVNPSARLRRSDSQPAHPWWNQIDLGCILSEVGRDDEACEVWRTAVDELREAGRSGFAVTLEVELLWSTVATGKGDPEAVHDLLVAHHDALLVSRPSQESGVAALHLAAVELLCDRPETALRWLQRATVFRCRTPEVRAVGAAAYSSLGLPIRWDELPAPVPEADPRMEQLTGAFARLASGETEAARSALHEIRTHPGRLSRVLGRVLARVVGG